MLSLLTLAALFRAGELFENPYMCAVCDIPFDKPGDVLQHVNSVHLQINLECRYCGEAFTVGSFPKAVQGPFSASSNKMSKTSSFWECNVKCSFPRSKTNSSGLQRSDNLERHEAEHEQREPPKRQRLGHFIEEVINKCQQENTITGVLTGTKRTFS